MSKPKLSAKDYLSQAYRIDQRINSKIEQVQSLRDLAEKASATLSDVPPSRGTRNIHRIEDVIAKMMDMESEISADMKRLLNLRIRKAPWDFSREARVCIQFCYSNNNRFQSGIIVVNSGVLIRSRSRHGCGDGVPNGDRNAVQPLFAPTS